MENLESPQVGTLAEQVQKQNSNLRRLIEAIAQLVSTSRELIARLQPEAKAMPPETTKQD